MSDQALYQKYRPQTFDEVLGQEHVVEALQKAAANDRIAHAYIFSGTRGTGKTSLARIFARAIGTSPRDLYEMDGASNRGIDEIRALRDELHTLPFESKYKVYIIDEVHMLTKEAFNALLKTLEEPPQHVVFILATTEFEKLPDTIVSRCQSFVFKTPGAPILKEMLLRAAKKEKVSLEPAAAELIALIASGSFMMPMERFKRSLPPQNRARCRLMMSPLSRALHAVRFFLSFFLILRKETWTAHC